MLNWIICRIVIHCVRKVAVHLQMVLDVMSASVYKGLNFETSILTTKYTYRTLSAQRLSERTVYRGLTAYVGCLAMSLIFLC
jgi:hypothetical protein